jgi:hypothetical protein
MGTPIEAGDFTLDMPLDFEARLCQPIEAAIELVCNELDLPLIGGPSGKGWSRVSTAQRCPRLFSIEHVIGAGQEARNPAAPLQIGALYHFLQALYYAAGLGPCALSDKGLIAEAAIGHRRGKRPKFFEVPPNAADEALKLLKEMSTPLEADLQATVEGTEKSPRPSAKIVAEAERCFDAHTQYYGEGNEDVIPLAIEWWANNDPLDYTCRYDIIARLGEQDPLCSDALPPGSVVVFERKTAAYLSEMAQSGWFLDGEILGELLNWQPSGCEALFGPLAAVVVDIVTKAKKQQFLRVVVPPTTPAVANHGKWIRYMQAEMHRWEATGVYPQYFTQCFDKWGKCGAFDLCAGGGK